MSKFKVGDMVVATREEPKGMTGVVRGFDDLGLIAVEFEGFDGHGCLGDDYEDLTPIKNGWWMQENQLVSPAIATNAPAAAKFHVVYVEDGDDVFDTQAEAEAFAEDLAADEPGAKVAVLRVVSTTTLDLAIERFA